MIPSVTLEFCESIFVEVGSRFKMLDRFLKNRIGFSGLFCPDRDM